MKTTITVGAFGLCLLALGASLWGFALRLDMRDQLISRELERSRLELSAMKDALVQYQQQSQSLRVACREPSNSGAFSQTDGVERAVQTALEKREQQKMLEAKVQAQPSSENLEAFAEGEQLLEDAVAAKRWSDIQAESLRRLMTRVTGEQREDLLRQLAFAINEGKVKVNTDGPPL